MLDPQRKHLTLVRTCLCALLALASSGILPSLAQNVGILRGVVSDRQGNPLPGAIITVKSAKNPGTESKGAVTDAKGQYRIAGLPPGDDYQVSCAFPSMATVVQGPVVVQSDTVSTTNFILVQELVTTIKVEAVGSIVDTSSATTKTTVNEEFAATLPILGRTYTDLLTLAPGVTDTDGDGKPNVHGAREVDFQTRLDGVNITDPFGGEDTSQINIEAIEEIQVILTGANAEYGRAQGGVASVTTKSGGNDFEGSFKVYYQSRAFDGDGAHNQDAINLKAPTPQFHTIKPFLTAGGPLVKDHIWYFLANQYIDQQEPINIIGVTRNQTIQGWNEFGKATWQMNPDNKSVLEMLYDPRETTGNRLGIGVSPRSDYSVVRATPVLTGRETWVISPSILLESTVSYLKGRQKVRPVAELFPNSTLACDFSVPLDLLPVTCNRIPNDSYTQKLDTGQIDGPWWVSQDSSSSRLTAKQDLSFYVDDLLGSHQFKVGYEWLEEGYSTDVTQRPLRYEFGGGRGRTRTFLWADFENRDAHARADASAQAVYFQDSWKILPNLTVNLGVRIDREDLSAPGNTFFDPTAERARFNALASQVFSNFNPDPTAWTAAGGVFNEQTNPATGTMFCDISGPAGAPDGVCNEVDRIATSRIFTRHEDEQGPSFYFTQSETQFHIPPCGSPDRLGSCRSKETFHLKNVNPAPRASIAWDPFGDGKTKLYGTYGRFYDRLFLATIIPEQARDFAYISFQSTDGGLHFNSPSRRNFQIYEVDRNLRTPYTDEVTFGLDRELTPEFSISLRYISRQGTDQIQTRDINHFFRDQNLDGVPDDIFLTDDPGAQPVKQPDTFPDLYALNPFFGGVYFLGNVNTSDYKALELNLVKRLHHNWQFDASYTYSVAKGFAEAFDDFFLGGDTSQVQHTFGFLSFDERHFIKFNAVANLPKEIQFGTRVTWESGLPFSLIRRGFTFDENANPTFRQIYPTGQRNDQRNTGRWNIDVNLRKSLTLGKAKAGVDFTVTNLLNSDDLEIHAINDAFGSFQLVDESQRRFGRRFQLGFTMNF